MKVLSLFSGIGAFEKALDNLKIPYELVSYCEIDKYASKSYSAIHNVPESMNLGDITKVDEKALPKDIDLITYGFPCQDISLAGKQKGLFNEDGTQTRSGLFFEALRIIEETQPRVAIAENVKNLTGKKFKEQFQIVLNSLEQAGYNNYWAVLNLKDFGIPQNRERVFIVSIRKDLDTGFFQFPVGFPLELRLKDMLEAEVDEKYYISTSKIEKFLNSSFAQEKSMIQSGNVCSTLLARDYKDPKCVVEEPCVKQIGNLMPSKTRANPNQGRLYDPNGLSPTLGAMQGGNRQPFVTVHKTGKIIKVGNVYPSGGQNGNVYDEEGISPTIISGVTNTKGNGGIGSNNAPKVLIREATKKGYAEAVEGDSINFEQPNSKTRRGRVGHGVAQTLTTSPQQGVVVSEPTIQRIDIPQTVKVRKYEVDCKLLCECLRNHKLDLDLSNKDIASVLSVPITKVEHWFRRDNCFAIPDPEVWMDLKKLLEIKTDEFDESIMTFEEKEGVYEKSERHYFDDGIAPTLTSTSAGNEKIIVVGNYMPSGHDASRIVDENGIAPTVKENHGTVTAVAMRGRYDENGEIQQNIEVSEREYANATTTVQKDSLICEPQTLRIRKLTPKECFRLMGFSDEDFAKAEAVNSNTQLYKQAGNSIGVPVVEYIILALLDCGALTSGK